MRKNVITYETRADLAQFAADIAEETRNYKAFVWPARYRGNV